MAQSLPNAPQVDQNVAFGHGVTIGAQATCGPHCAEAPSSLPNAPAPHVVADRAYVIVQGLDTAATFADVGMTRYCIGEHRCREANPLMPQSQAGQVGVNIAFLSSEMVSSYWAKKKGSKLWWIGPTAAIAMHTVGFWSGYRLR